MNPSPAIRELLAVHEVFRCLGFLPQHLFVECYQNMVQFTLRRSGREPNDAEFTIDIASPENFKLEDWGPTVEWWNKAIGDGTDLILRKQIMNESYIIRNKVRLLIALGAKGLIDPIVAKETV